MGPGLRRAALLLGLGLPGAVPAAAQLRVDISPGARVRVTTLASPERRITGKVVRTTADSLVLVPRAAPAGAEAGYALPQLATVEVRGGRDRKRGALIVGGAFTAITAVAGGIDLSRGRVTGSDLALTVVGNAAFGALIGLALGPTGWRRLPLPGRAAAAPAR